VGASVVVAAALAGLALAGGGSSGRPTVKAVRNASVGARIVADRRRRTLYRLAPESAARLLCRGSCVRTWRPLTVRSRATKLVAGPGVDGRLALVRRPGGALQVTLRGMPLYRYRGDHAPGQVRGNGRHVKRGEWHVVLAAAPKPVPTPPPASTPTPTPGPRGTPTPPPA
jgi:predicted lipoprotein with Yx(FWY)xxD motif